MHIGMVHNFHERLVAEALNKFLRENKLDFDQNDYEDAACLALNALPPRYIRYDVDMTFFLSENEADELANQAAEAVAQAVERVRQHKRHDEQL